MKVLLRVLGALVGAVVVVAGALYVLANRRLNRTFAVQEAALLIPADSASIERGRYLAHAVAGCADCHGESLEGRLVADAGPVGKIWSPNLTRGEGGLGDSLSPAQWAAALRDGVARSGRPLMIMPAADYADMSDEDVGAIVAYVKSVAPVNNSVRKSYLGPLGWFLYVSGKFPTLTQADLVSHDGRRQSMPPRGATAQYGKYLAAVGGCAGCHRPDFTGGPIPGMPPDAKPASNLTPLGIGHYSEADFFTAMRDGKRPGGVPLDTLMPYRFTRQMSDDDIRALYLFLKTVPSKAFASR